MRFFSSPTKEGELLHRIGDLLRLRYVYEDEPISTVSSSTAAQEVRASLSRLLEGVPLELVEQLRVAAIQARASQIELLAAQLAQHSPEAAARVRALAKEFRYEELASALAAVANS